MMKRIQMLLVALLLVLVCAGCVAEAQSEDPPQSKPEIREPMTEAFGVVRCRESLNVLVDFPLKINNVFVREGQVVQKGDALAEAQRESPKEEIALKKLQLTNEKEALAILEKEIAQKKEVLAAAQDPEALKLKHDLTTAQANHEKLLAELQEKKNLAAAGLITQNEADNFEKNIDASQKNIEDIQFALKNLDYGRALEIEQMESQLPGKKNGIALLELELKQLSDQKSSPYFKDGSIVCTLDKAIISGVYTSTGDMPTPGTKLFSLINLNTKYVEARIPEEFIKDVKVGMEANIIPLADKSHCFTGTVTAIAQKATQGNGETNVLVEIDVKDEEGFLIPDFNVNVEIKREQNTP